MENIKQKDLSNEIKAARDSQLNFAYYVIGLATAAIAYTVNLTLNMEMKWSQVPLGISILAFFASILLGLSYIRTLNASMQEDIQFFKQENKIRANQMSPDKEYNELLGVYNKRLNREKEMSIANATRFKLQRLYFIMAISSFLCWRLWEMYLLTYPK